MNTKAFENWIRRQIYNERQEGNCRKLLLRHIGAAGKVGSEVLTIDLVANDDFPRLAAEEMLAAAQSDADGLGLGVQSYIVQALYGDTLKPFGRQTLRVRGQSDEDESDGDLLSEPATKHGLLTQLMRHNEAAARTSMGAMTSLFDTMQKTLHKQSEMVEGLVTNRFQSFELIESLLSQKHERDMDMLREQRKGEFQQEAMEKFSTLLPIVANKIAGKQLLPAGDPQRMALEALFKSMTPEQLSALGNVLAPEQLALVLSLAQENLPKDKA